jgi:hypothetical protein
MFFTAVLFAYDTFCRIAYGIFAEKCHEKTG